MRLSHLAAALLMVTIWGFNFIVIRWGLNEVPPLTLTVMRFALAAFPAVLFVRRPQPSWRLVTGTVCLLLPCSSGCYSPECTPVCRPA